MSRTIAIIGSAIGGPTLALQILSHAGLRRTFNPVLFDAAAAPDTRDVKHGSGATVGLFGNGLYPLLRLGLGDAVRKAGFEYRALGVWHSDLDGRMTRLGWSPEYMYSPSLDSGVVFFERSALQKLLVDAVRDRGGEVCWGKKAVGFAVLPDGRSTITFADGSKVAADLVVGADGAYSAVRRHILTLRNPRTARERWLPDFMSLTGLYGLSAAPKASGAQAPFDESHAVWMDPGMISTGPSPGGKTRWDLVLPEARPPDHNHKVFDPPTGPEKWLSVIVPGPYDPSATASLLRRLSHVGHPYAGTMGDLFATADRIIHTPLRQHVWDKDEIAISGAEGHAVLVGDAARLMLPTSGQGTGFAIEDATVLASMLLKHCVDGIQDRKNSGGVIEQPSRPSSGTHDSIDNGSTPTAEAEKTLTSDIATSDEAFDKGINAALDEYAALRVPRSRQMAALASLAAKWAVAETGFWRTLRRLASTWKGKHQDVWPFDKRFDVE